MKKFERFTQIVWLFVKVPINDNNEKKFDKK